MSAGGTVQTVNSALWWFVLLTSSALAVITVTFKQRKQEKLAQ
jgi:hypothetical protein